MYVTYIHTARKEEKIDNFPETFCPILVWFPSHFFISSHIHPSSSSPTYQNAPTLLAISCSFVGRFLFDSSVVFSGFFFLLSSSSDFSLERGVDRKRNSDIYVSLCPRLYNTCHMRPHAMQSMKRSQQSRKQERKTDKTLRGEKKRNQDFSSFPFSPLYAFPFGGEEKAREIRVIRSREKKKKSKNLWRQKELYNHKAVSSYQVVVRKKTKKKQK